MTSLLGTAQSQLSLFQKLFKDKPSLPKANNRHGRLKARKGKGKSERGKGKEPLP
jgi:hypothetical protein